MKKLLSIFFALAMLLGWMGVTALAENNDAAAKNALAYTIMIPTATTLNDEAHTNVQLGGAEGEVSISLTAAGTDRTNVYYTVDLTYATLTNGTDTIATTYAYRQGDGEYAELTEDTRVVVYEGATVKPSVVQVTADETEWQAAPFGEYTASVTFNFAAEEVPLTVGDVLKTVSNFPTSASSVTAPENAWKNATDKLLFLKSPASDNLDWLCCGTNFGIYSNAVLTAKEEGVYEGSTAAYGEGSTIWTFTMEDGVLKSIGIVNSGFSGYDGTYTAPPKEPVLKRVDFKDVNVTINGMEVSIDYFPIFAEVSEGVTYYDADGIEYNAMNPNIAYALVPADKTIPALRTVRATWNNVFSLPSGEESGDADGVNDTFVSCNLVGGDQQIEKVVLIKDEAYTAPPTYNGVSLADIYSAYGDAFKIIWSATAKNEILAYGFSNDLAMWNYISRDSNYSVCISRDF